jgi:putative membrane protein
MKLTPADHERINAAIADVETRTSGEVFCILAHRVSDYRETGIAWTAALSLVLPALLIPLGFGAHWFDWVPLVGGWRAAHATAADAVTSALTAYALLQLVVFLACALLFSIPALRKALTPRGVKRDRVHAEALQQFRAKGLHLTEGRTGVLIFASLEDHLVEVVADEGIHGKVSPEVWADAVEALVAHVKRGHLADGFVAAIGLCGAVLAQHFPPTGENPNEIPDQLVEI